MLGTQTSEELLKVSIVDAVYRTVKTNGAAFQRQVQEKLQEERQAQEAERKQDLRDQRSKNADVLALSAKAKELSKPQPVSTPEAPPAPEASAPNRGQAFDAIA